MFAARSMLPFAAGVALRGKNRPAVSQAVTLRQSRLQAVADGLAVGFFNHFAENILANAGAVFLFDDGRRHFAGTETVNAYTRRDFFETFGDFLIETRRRHFNR